MDMILPLVWRWESCGNACNHVSARLRFFWKEDKEMQTELHHGTAHANESDIPARGCLDGSRQACWRGRSCLRMWKYLMWWSRNDILNAPHKPDFWTPIRNAMFWGVWEADKVSFLPVNLEQSCCNSGIECTNVNSINGSSKSRRYIVRNAWRLSKWLIYEACGGIRSTMRRLASGTYFEDELLIVKWSSLSSLGKTYTVLKIKVVPCTNKVPWKQPSCSSFFLPKADLHGHGGPAPIANSLYLWTTCTLVII